MTVLEYLDNKYPDPIEKKGNKRKWQFFTMTAYVEMLNDVVHYLTKKGHIEMMTGMLQHEYYGYMFVKKNSHVSVSASMKGQVDRISMFVTVEQLFEPK
jgi:hypothetical protein